MHLLCWNISHVFAMMLKTGFTFWICLGNFQRWVLKSLFTAQRLKTFGVGLFLPLRSVWATFLLSLCKYITRLPIALGSFSNAQKMRQVFQITLKLRKILDFVFFCGWSHKVSLRPFWLMLPGHEHQPQEEFFDYNFTWNLTIICVLRAKQ